MTKNCTSIEQSQKLIELGIDTSSADMCYDLGRGEEKAHLECDNFIAYFTNDEYPEMADRYIPAWSLSALLELMPKELEDDLDLCYGTFDGNGEYQALWACSCMNRVSFGDTLIDAVFKVVCWLLENKKL